MNCNNNSPKFGDALFERSLKFRPASIAKRSTERLERLKSFQGNPGRAAQVLAKRTEKDFYDPSGRMALNKAAIPHVKASAEQEQEFRAEHLDKLRRNKAKPRAIKRAKIGLELARLKLTNARLAESSAGSAVATSSLTSLRKSLERLTQLGYDKSTKPSPVYVHAQGNSGSFTLNHPVHEHTKTDDPTDFVFQEKTFEGMAVTPSQNSFLRSKLIKDMTEEMPMLKAADQKAAIMKGKSENKALAQASYKNQEAEAHHAIAHNSWNSFSLTDYNEHSQQARKATKQANEALQRIPDDKLTSEHARLSYNLKTKAQHFCDRHGQHIPDDSRSQEICGAIKVEDVPQNVRTIKKFSDFDPSYGLDFDPSKVTVHL